MKERVREFWLRIEARDWESARALLADDFVGTWPHTGERFVGRDSFIAMNREYPEGWSLRVLQIACDGDTVVSEIEVVHGAEVHNAASFFTMRDGQIAAVTEYWVQANAAPAPEWRQKFVSATVRRTAS
jgi:ketosteroid isomerase-like protein